MNRLCWILIVYAVVSVSAAAFIRLGMAFSVPAFVLIGMGETGTYLEQEAFEYATVVLLVALLIAAAVIVGAAGRIECRGERTRVVLLARWGSALINAIAGGVLLSYGLRPVMWDWYAFATGCVALGVMTLLLAFVAEPVGRLVQKRKSRSEKLKHGN